MALVWDCFTFFNELELLGLRLEELYPVVDRFVIVESDMTFRGNPKPYLYLDNANMFSDYADKIVHVQVRGDRIPINPTGPHPAWQREFFQRNAIKGALVGEARPRDIILISDLDEIPRRADVARLLPEAQNNILDLGLDVFCYGINIKTGNVHTIKMLAYKLMRQEPQQVRKLEAVNFRPNCGWEFSTMGDPERISYKLKNFAHHEIDTPDITEPIAIMARMNALADVTGGEQRFERVEIDDTWPEAVKRDREFWSRFEW